MFLTYQHYDPPKISKPMVQFDVKEDIGKQNCLH
jgi:hypothetical protein